MLFRSQDLRTQTKKMERNTRIGETINFSQDGKGPITSYLNNHWYNRESWGIWSDGKNSDILLPIPNGNPTKILFLFNALISPSHPEQKLDILINGHLEKSVTITSSSNNKVEVLLPENTDENKLLKIEFQTPNALSPKDAKISASDNRVLGIGLISAEFQK